MEEGKVTHPDRGSPQGGVISPTLSNIFLHEVDRQWSRSDGVALGNVRLVRYADDMVLLARTEQQARQVWEQLQTQFAALRLVVNQEKSRLTTLAEGFAFLGFEFRKAPRRILLMWPREKACRNILQRIREAVVSVEWAGRRGDPETEPDFEWVVYLFPSRQQQSDVPQGGLGRSERVAVVASTKAPMPLADCQETMGVSLPS
jgi:reverse transcriptase-like protein